MRFAGPGTRKRKEPSRYSDRLLAACALLALASLAPAQTNIDTGDTGAQYAWSPAVGWVDLSGDVTSGVVVRPTYLSGYAWSPATGWIHFGARPADGVNYTNTSADDSGVNNDGSGNLSGYAWGQNIGWIAFDTSADGGSSVTISAATGRFAGYAWSPSVGWIGFDGFPDSAAATDGFAASAPATMSTLVNFLLGSVTLNEASRRILDFNADGQIDIADFTFLEVSFP